VTVTFTGDIFVAKPTKMAPTLARHVVAAAVLFDRGFAFWTELNRRFVVGRPNEASIDSFGNISCFSLFSFCWIDSDLPPARPGVRFFAAEKAEPGLATILSPTRYGEAIIALAVPATRKYNLRADRDLSAVRTRAPPHGRRIGSNKGVKTEILKSRDQGWGDAFDVALFHDFHAPRHGAANLQAV
jgi:hypothetical protein